MNQHQLNGVASFLETLDSAAAKGIVLSGWSGIQLTVDDGDTGMEIVYSESEGRYKVVPK